MKPILLILGFAGRAFDHRPACAGPTDSSGPGVRMRTTHQHSGYLTVAVSMVYIAWSLATIATMPKERKP